MTGTVRPILMAAVLAFLPLLAGRAAAQPHDPDVVLTQADVDLLIAVSFASGNEELEALVEASGVSKERFALAVMKLTMVNTAFREPGEGGDWMAALLSTADAVKRFSDSAFAFEFSDEELELLDGNKADIEEAFQRLAPDAD